MGNANLPLSTVCLSPSASNASPFLPLLLLSLSLVLPISLSLSLLCAQYRRDYFIVCVQWKQDLYGHVYNHSLVRKQGYRLSNWLSKVLESLSYQYPSFFCYVWGACCMNAIFFVSLVKLNNISQCSCHIWPILFGIMSKNDGQSHTWASLLPFCILQMENVHCLV